jgi:hypothetical protein
MLEGEGHEDCPFCPRDLGGYVFTSGENADGP